MRNLLLSLISILIFHQYSSSQDGTRLASQSIKLPNNFLTKINGRIDKLNSSMSIKTEKYLKKLLKSEEQLKNKMYSLDSNATKNLFLLGADAKYRTYLHKVQSDSMGSLLKRAEEYLPYEDSLFVLLSFIKNNSSLSELASFKNSDLSESLSKLNVLKMKMMMTDELKEYITERKGQINHYLAQFAIVPENLKSLYRDYNKHLYYFNSQLSEFKEALKSPDQMLVRSLSVLKEIPEFQKYIQEYSKLSSLFPTYGNLGTAQSVSGLQTKSQVNQSIQTRLGGVGSIEALSSNVNSAQDKLAAIKDKIREYGNGGSDVDISDFKPNTMRTKSLLSRIEFGTNIQTQRSNYFYPVTTDFGFSIGYKLNGLGNSIGLGGSLKMGWGEGFNHIKISGQGMSLRSFIDLRLKGNYFISGGFEYNYQKPIYTYRIIRSIEEWQRSGLLGVSKIVKLKTKVLKKAKMQLLCDFLSYTQTPKTQPVKFRIGYSF